MNYIVCIDDGDMPGIKGIGHNEKTKPALPIMTVQPVSVKKEWLFPVKFP